MAEAKQLLNDPKFAGFLRRCSVPHFGFQPVEEDRFGQLFASIRNTGFNKVRYRVADAKSQPT